MCWKSNSKRTDIKYKILIEKPAKKRQTESLRWVILILNPWTTGELRGKSAVISFKLESYECVSTLQPNSVY
jgi:hypothetical protein